MTSARSDPRTTEPVHDVEWQTVTDRSEREESRLLRWDAALRRLAAKEERAEAARQRADAARQRAEIARAQAGTAELRAEEARSRVESVLEMFNRTGSRADRAGRAAAPAAPDGAAAQRDRLADRREQVADERDSEADERDRLADQRDAAADARDHLADEREATLLGARDEPVETKKPGPKGSAGDTEAYHRSLLESGARLRAEAAAVADSLADEAESIADAFDASAARDGRVWRTRVASTERQVARTLRRNATRLREADKPLEGMEPLPRLPSRTDADPVHDGRAPRSAGSSGSHRRPTAG